MNKILRFIALTLLYVTCSLFLYVIPASVAALFGAPWYIAVAHPMYIFIFGMSSLCIVAEQFHSSFDENYYSK